MGLFCEKLSLWVSLPRNEVELARAAIDGGADALKVHIAANHFASGTRFGSLDEERDRIAEIIEVAAGKPVGIVPGDSYDVVPQHLDILRDLGISFVSIYAHHCPARWLSPKSALPIALAPSEQFAKELIPALSCTGAAMIEASIMPHERYGQPVTAADLAVYHSLRQQTDLPIIVPTQLKWTPEDVSALCDTGIDVLMIGAIVTGATSPSLFEATKSFRQAIDRS